MKQKVLLTKIFNNVTIKNICSIPGGLEVFLFVGFSKWDIEKKVRKPFFWISEPFLKSNATGFISPKVALKNDFPANLIVDTEYFNEMTENRFFPKETLFFAEKWNSFCKKNAVFIKDIIVFENGKENILKKEFQMLPFGCFS